ncbi:MAG: hypothetical protein NUW06_04595 [Candidatus Acetothermia bacterium]|jgi:hypothetical protein|nr:hypothetical protein [Candidatus Acetothermia bacterium]MDH7505262.1 hypothetical protein [Candidatus Acetothermia bacterium]
MLKPLVLILIAGVIFFLTFQATGLAAEEEAGQVDPLIPGLASFIVPGTGQLLIGDSDKALVHAIIDLGVLAAGCSAALLFPVPLVVWEVTVVARLSLSTYSALDAYSSTRELNRYHAALSQLISYMVQEG